MKPILAYVVVLLIIFGRAFFPPEGQMIFGDDIAHQYYFYRQYFNYWIGQGIFPWWNPYLFGGMPFVANPIANIWSPPTWLFVLLPLWLAYPVHMALHLFIAMTGLYWLGRRFLDPLSSWVSGVVFGLSGFFLMRLWGGHVDVIAASSYIPWVFGMFLALAQRGTKRDICVAGAVFALQLFAGYQTISFYTLEAVGIMTLTVCVVKKSFFPMLRMIAAIGLGIGLAALQIIPLQQFVNLSIRTIGFPYSWTAYGSLEWRNLLQLLNPFILGNLRTYAGPPPNLIEHAMYIGRLPLIIAAIGLFRKKSLVFWLIALFSLWVSLGPHAPIDLQYMLWKLVPVYHVLRIPPRHLVLFIFSMSMLVGLGLNGLSRWGTLHRVICVLILFEALVFASSFIELAPVPGSGFDQTLIGQLKDTTELVRYLPNFGVWIQSRDSLDFDAAMSYRLFNATGYDPSILRNYYEFVDAASGNKEPSIIKQDVQVPYMKVYSPYLNFLNIKYVLEPPALDPIGGTSGERYTLLREDIERDYRLYENKTVLPRFYFVPTVTSLPREEAKELLITGSVDLTKTVLTSAKRAFAAPCDVSNARASVLSYTPNAVVLRVVTPCDAALVSSEVMYPGWSATIDGNPAEIFEGNLAFRVIDVPKGEHTVEYRFTPVMTYIGALISAISIVVIVFLHSAYER